MFYRSRLVLICCFLSLFIAPPLALSADEITPTSIQLDSERIKRAFLLSDQKQWSEAIFQVSSLSDQTLQTLMQWQYLLDGESGASFYEIKEFISKHPDWPEQKRLRIRAEMILPDSDVSPEEIVSWFGSKEPITGIGKVSLVNALNKLDKPPLEKTELIIRSAWVAGDFTESQEKSIIENYGSMLRKEDDIARTDRLIWEKKTTPAERMFARVDAPHQQLYKARMELQDNKKTAVKLVNKLPPEMKKDVGLMFDRMVFRAKKDDDAGVREILLAAPKKVPYPEKWWKYREVQIREAMSEGNSKLAEHLLANHAQEEGQEFTQGYADASWLKGRLLLEYKKQPKDAYKIFTKMFAAVKYPVSKSRAAYWAGRTARKDGDTESAKSWFNKATAYPTTFYGQLASLVLNGTAPLHIPPSPVVSDDIRAEFNARGIVQAIKLCIAYDDVALAEKLINHLVTDADDENEAMLASELGSKAGKAYLSVRGAKKALRNNVVLVDTGYPVPKTPDDIALPRELALSITRQESEFNSYAKSPSGALGLMQLLPSTAKETAHKNDMDYDSEKLYEPEYNMLLGSLYLRRMIDNYDGSMIMAIAAYNAGPGNVYKWTQKFGKPQNNIDGAIDWIENIPFAETRNYVQRVLENLQIYRYIEAQKSTDMTAAKLQLGDDLLR